MGAGPSSELGQAKAWWEGEEVGTQLKMSVTKREERRRWERWL